MLFARQFKYVFSPGSMNSERRDGQRGATRSWKRQDTRQVRQKQRCRTAHEVQAAKEDVNTHIYSTQNICRSHTPILRLESSAIKASPFQLLSLPIHCDIRPPVPLRASIGAHCVTAQTSTVLVEVTKRARICGDRTLAWLGYRLAFLFETVVVRQEGAGSGAVRTCAEGGTCLWLGVVCSGGVGERQGAEEDAEMPHRWLDVVFSPF